MGKSVRRPLSAQALADALGAVVLGDGERLITGVSSLEHALPGDLAFFSDSKHRAAAVACAAGSMIVREGDAALVNCVRIVHPAPHAAFASALELLFPPPPFSGNVSARADVAIDARVEGARVEGLARVGARSVVGAGTVVHAQASIAEDVSVGQDCVIYPGARLLAGVRVGNRCIIHSGAVLGADGFGFQPTASGWRKVAQVGTVIVGDDVEIGANTTIDRGAIEDTIIGNGVKIDNLVQIAHNVRIGDHTAIAACAGIAGSAVIGARCMIGGAAMISGHITICDGAVISGGTLIANSVDVVGRYTGVFPSATHRDWMRIASALRRTSKRKPD